MNISFPVSDIQQKAIGKNRQWVMDRIQPMMDFARERFDFVAIGAQDASRADRDFLHEFILACFGRRCRPNPDCRYGGDTEPAFHDGFVQLVDQRIPRS